MLQLFMGMCTLKPAPNVTYFSQNKSFIMPSNFCCSKWTKICAVIEELGHILPFNGRSPASLFQQKNNVQNYLVQTINKLHLHSNTVKWSAERESHSYRYKCCFQQRGRKKTVWIAFYTSSSLWMKLNEESNERHRRINILFLASCLVLIARTPHLPLFCSVRDCQTVLDNERAKDKHVT